MKPRPLNVIEFLSDDALGNVSPLARLLFLGLCCLVNDDSDIPDRPARIRALALPYDHEANGEELLRELEQAGLIRRSRTYDDDDEDPYLTILNFPAQWLSTPDTLLDN